MKKLNNFKSSTYTSTSTTFRSLQWVALVRSGRKPQSPQWIQHQCKVDQSNSAWKVGMVLLKEWALWMFIVYRCVLSIKVLVDILGTSRFIYKCSMHMYASPKCHKHNVTTLCQKYTMKKVDASRSVRYPSFVCMWCVRAWASQALCETTPGSWKLSSRWAYFWVNDKF